MRRYVDPVEVRRGWVGTPGEGPEQEERGQQGPEQFVWRGRLWQVRAVLAHWVETGPWWQSGAVRAVVGTDDQGVGRAPVTDLLGERELWRVEAARSRDAAGGFDLSFDWEAGSWQLVACAD